MSITLNQPVIGSTGWGADLNSNFNVLQNILSNTAFTIDTTNYSTSSTSYVDSGISVTLPLALSSSTNSVLIRVALTVAGTGNMTPRFTLYRGATDLTPSGRMFMACLATTNNAYPQNVTFDFLDTPGSTSIQAYKLYWNVDAGTGYFGYSGGGGSYTGQITMSAREICT